MARYRKHHQEELEESEHLNGNGNDSTSSRQEVKMDEEANRLEKASSYRSKHSETEQRRRSKINERFQVLRALIPQNDQKKDKASLLMEVIEYIQFLQEKLHIYEASHQGWNQEPTKLIPWRCHHGRVENIGDLSQIAPNGSTLENHGSPELFPNVHNPLESILFTEAVEKVQSPLLASESWNMHMQPNVFDAVVRSSLPTDHLQEPTSNTACMPSQSLLFDRPNVNDSAPSNDTSKEEAFTTPVSTESGAVSISCAYSLGVLDTLTQALVSSGVDLSHTNITVQMDVEQRAKTSSSTPASKMHVNQSFVGQTMPYTEVDNSGEDCEPVVKRLRRQAS